jgi:hypothetical protein
MDMQVRAAAICCICKCSVDIHAPHAIVKHDYAHLDCADAYDAQDLGSIDLIEDVFAMDEETEFEEEYE